MVIYKTEVGCRKLYDYQGRQGTRIHWEIDTGVYTLGYDWATSLLLCAFMHWRSKWHPTPVFLPEESQGRGSQVGCHLWGRTETDTTEVT